jgi:hypothetical protein
LVLLLAKERLHAAAVEMIYAIKPEQALVEVKFKDRVTIDDIAAYAAALRADARFDPGFSEIVDLTDVEQFQIEAKDAMALADRIDPFAPNARRAFVARTDAQYHVARMHQLLRGADKRIGIFVSANEARGWILSGEPAQPLDSGDQKKMRARLGQ